MTILMAEDDPDDRVLTREAMESAHVANELRFVNRRSVPDGLPAQGG